MLQPFDELADDAVEHRVASLAKRQHPRIVLRALHENLAADAVRSLDAAKRFPKIRASKRRVSRCTRFCWFAETPLGRRERVNRSVCSACPGGDEGNGFTSDDAKGRPNGRSEM
jgi:hypothetical protein